ncbi:MAG: class I SAM-dependent methyltransferase [Terriglobia bacterium]
MLGGLQYQLLKRVSPGEPNHASGKAYQGRSKLKVLLGAEIIDSLRGKWVIDFGCGEGEEAVEIAREGAARVTGIDIREPLLELARQRAENAGLADRCFFQSRAECNADVIISIDSFEHFRDPAAILRAMYDLLRPGGFVAVSFGPTWYHPYGGHLFSVFPWAHVIFSEEALIRWRSDIRNDGATRFGEVAGGLNQMTISKFRRLVRESPFHLSRLELIPVRKLRFAHNFLTQEFTTSVVRCKLEKTGEPKATNG